MLQKTRKLKDRHFFFSLKKSQSNEPFCLGVKFVQFPQALVDL